MRKRRQSGIIAAGAVLFLIACVAPGSAEAFRVFKVDPFCPDPSVYTTIQAAVDAAAAYSDDDHADYVWISDNTDINGYKKQHVVIDDPESVIIEGGFFDCTDFDPGTDQTSVSGAGNDGGPVFEIVGNGSSVYLGNLFISGAQRGSGDNGGGINFTGHGEVDLARTTVFNNHAGSGAGINVSASGGPAVLRLMHDTLIYLNTASVSGGGIRLEGESRLFLLEPNTEINGNNAANYGGGLLVLGPAHADIGATGGGFGDGVIAANHAANGGGIAVIDNGNGSAALRVFADGSNRPTPIVENRADTNGGAVYVKGYARAKLYAPHFFKNIGEDGAVVYYDPAASNDGSISFNGSDDYDPERVVALGGTTFCIPADPQCGIVDGNSTRHADDSPSSGAIVRSPGGKFEGVYFRMRDNIAGAGLHLDGADAYLARCLITDNSVSGNVLLGPVANLVVGGCTIANNSIGDNHVFYLAGSSSVSFESDIVDQPGKLPVDNLPVGVLQANDLLVNDAAFLDHTNPSIVTGTPVFVDAASRDYHLRGDSLGIDFAANHDIFIPELYSDLDGLQVVDLAQVADFIGPYDLGAYERQYFCAADTLFCNGFDKYGYQP